MRTTPVRSTMTMLERSNHERESPRAAEPDFPPDEYATRIANIRAGMAAAGLDGLLLTSGPNLTYLTGYPSPTRAGSRPYLFILPLSGDPDADRADGARTRGSTLLLGAGRTDLSRLVACPPRSDG